MTKPKNNDQVTVGDVFELDKKGKLKKKKLIKGKIVTEENGDQTIEVDFLDLFGGENQ
jgi:hypothetical protein